MTCSQPTGNMHLSRNGARPAQHHRPPHERRLGEQVGLGPESPKGDLAAPHRDLGPCGRGDRVPGYFRASAEDTGIQAHGARGRDHLSDPFQLKAGCG